MIEKRNAYTDSRGGIHTDLAAAQAAELFILIDSNATAKPSEVEEKTAKAIARTLVENKDAVIDVLTTAENSRPRARKANGGTKKRQAAQQAAANAA